MQFPNKARTNASQAVVCYKCGKPGHVSKNCFAQVSGNPNGFVPGYPPKGFAAGFAANGFASNGQFVPGLVQNAQFPPHFVPNGQVHMVSAQLVNTLLVMAPTTRCLMDKIRMDRLRPRYHLPNQRTMFAQFVKSKSRLASK